MQANFSLLAICVAFSSSSSSSSCWNAAKIYFDLFSLFLTAVALLFLDFWAVDPARRARAASSMLVPLILAFDSCGVLFDGAGGLDLYFHAYLLFLASVAAVFARVCVADGRACAAPAATAALLVFLFLKLGAAVVFSCYPAVGIHGGDADLPQFLNDGSCLANLQVIVDAAVFPLSQLVPTGTSVLVDGEFKKPPEGAKQSVELRAEKMLGIGPVDPAKVSDPQDAAYGFRHMHTPIITTSDWEGADEMLQVTPLFSDAEKLEKELQKNPPPSESNVEAAKLIVKEKGDVVLLPKASKARTSVKTGPSITDAAMGRIAQTTKVISEGGYEKVFHQTFEILSGEKLKKSYACYLSTSSGPVMGVLYLSTANLAFCSDNPLSYKVGDQTQWSYYKLKNLVELRLNRNRLEGQIPGVTMSNFSATLHTMEKLLGLQDGYEEKEPEIFKRLVIVYNYPKGIKAFYMRLNDDQKTVAAMDVLVPKVGELIGGSQREESLYILAKSWPISGLVGDIMMNDAHRPSAFDMSTVEHA
ncbi:hypothetical protein ZIOFF_006592 [Zingiber officinale]|uniref:GRAM domain-containing protein n=1 Tax=Zingiber officinale TaxID=94328 RepID=A0A8J5HVR4_ZINOF|nr:hypothetical protein ZIOFF_006592 [Zingiber officinale]